jgi:hypothetical protein
MQVIIIIPEGQGEALWEMGRKSPLDSTVKRNLIEAQTALGKLEASLPQGWLLEVAHVHGVKPGKI